MDIYRSPLYMALSYEENQGTLHSLLAQVLWDISTYVNASSVMLSREVTNVARIFTLFKVKKLEKFMNSFPNITVSWIAKGFDKRQKWNPQRKI